MKGCGYRKHLAIPTPLHLKLINCLTHQHHVALLSIKQRELIASINGSVDFKETSFRINPGLAESFPWLHKIAADWQQYRFKSFKAIFITFVGAGTNGSVIISPEYNVNEGSPANEMEALNTQNSIQSCVWREIVCKLDINAMFGIGPRKQIRRGLVANDLATYDSAIVSVCTLGMANTSRVGSLYFEYEVDLIVPQSTVSAPVANTVSTFTIPAQTLNSGDTSGLSYVAVANNLGIEIVNSGYGLKFPSGNFRLDVFPFVHNAGNTDVQAKFEMYIDNTLATPYQVTARTEDYGLDIFAPMAYVISSSGSLLVNINVTVTSHNGSQSTFGSGGSRLIVTLL